MRSPGRHVAVSRLSWARPHKGLSWSTKASRGPGDRGVASGAGRRSTARSTFPSGERIDELASPRFEVPRLAPPDLVSLLRYHRCLAAVEQVGTTAQFYFYDWEPNLIDPEFAIGGRLRRRLGKSRLWQESEQR